MAGKKVFLTGATGTMGFQGVLQMLKHPDEIELSVLVRPSSNRHSDAHRQIAKFAEEGRLTVISGDLTDTGAIERGVRDADYVLHVGGMVSPYADHHPEETMRVNVGGARAIAQAVRKRPDGGKGVKVVYIGSVAQLGNRHWPNVWGRSGDPVWTSHYDVYAQSKVEAEREITEAGLPCWVSIRQTGILAPDILMKGTDPITFHVPLQGVLEWTNDEDSGRLLANLVLADLPDRFWKRFYNIGNGQNSRLTNFEFEEIILRHTGCPGTKKIFEPNWFATRNFHGLWYEDSDLLDDYLHYRSGISVDGYLARLRKRLPWYFRLTPYIPAFVYKALMQFVASGRPNGTLSWVKDRNEEKLNVYFGGYDEWRKIPGWDQVKVEFSDEERKPIRLDHGYDESKPESELDIDDMRQAAEYRGGRCLSETMTPGDLDTPLEWECHAGHRFTMTPRLVLLGGHWCPECFCLNADYEEIARHNPFFAQVL